MSFTPRLEQGVNDIIGLVAPKVRFKFRKETANESTRNQNETWAVAVKQFFL